MEYVAAFFVVFFGVAGIAAWLGDWSGWVVLACIVLMFVSAWPLHVQIFRGKTVDDDQQKQDEGYSIEQGIPYVQLPPYRH